LLKESLQQAGQEARVALLAYQRVGLA
jgi:hypothetical protein